MHKKKTVTILAIESSCDETAASVLRGNLTTTKPQFTALSNIVRSQIKIHSKFGGVVPEIAARAHAKAIHPVVEKALQDAFPKRGTEHSALSDHIDYIAVTTGPGLMPSLLVGVEFAKALSFASGVPMISVNHMEGHLYSPFGEAVRENQKQAAVVTFPILSAIVSGKHTTLVLQKNESHYQVLGDTVDDAAGEAFDKVAKLLELPYPGGPEISKLSEKGIANILFPRPMIDAPNFNFSFAGLKTAVLYHLKETYPKLARSNKSGLHNFNFGKLKNQEKADIARSFEEAVCDVITTKVVRAVKRYGCKTISLSGGVAANKRLRAQLKSASETLQVKFIVPDFRLCTDNAEMIAIASYFKLRAGYKPVSYKKVKADSGWELA
jgi:N6-L-threonylcarbamoyladenine synthase